MVDYMIEICKGMGLERIYGLMLSDNQKAINLMKKMGFTTESIDRGTVKATLNVEEEGI